MTYKCGTCETEYPNNVGLCPACVENLGGESSYVVLVRAEPMEELLPEWATGHATEAFEVGSQMRTRDGRRHGNAVVVAMDGDPGFSKVRITVITDYGNKVVYSPDEMVSGFHPPKWVMDPSKHIGVQKHAEYFDKMERALYGILNDGAVWKDLPLKHREQVWDALCAGASEQEPEVAPVAKERKGWGSWVTLNSVIHKQALAVTCPICGMDPNDQCVDEENKDLPAHTVHTAREEECPF